MTSYFGSSDLGLLMPEASMLNNQQMLGNLISFKVNAIIDNNCTSEFFNFTSNSFIVKTRTVIPNTHQNWFWNR